jgi:RNA polymerase sigma factor (sigma-70 family)
METDQSFQNLLEGVRRGDEEAAAELVRLFEHEVRRFVRYRLNSPKMRRLLDSVDVCQSVFAKFFVRVTEGQYELHNPRQLQQLLVKMANNKLLDHFRKQATARHGGSLADAGGQTIDWIADTAPQPSRAVEARELCDLLRARLSLDEQELLDQRMNGDDWPALADRTGMSSEAVRKRLTRAIDRAAEELGWEEMP